VSRYFDELERRLQNAAERNATAPGGAELERAPRRPRWTRRHRRLLVVAIAALAGLAVPAVAAITDLWRPDVRPVAPMSTAVAPPGSGFSCDADPLRHIDVGPPVGRDFTSVLGVLARPHGAVDDAFERRYLQGLNLFAVDVRGIRFLGTAADGRPYFVIPARGLGGAALPERCLRKLSPRERRLFARPPLLEPTICVVGGGGGGCSSLAAVRARGTFGSSGTVRGRATVAGIVPNGVRAVRVTYGRSTRDFPVHDNFFTFLVAIDVEGTVPDRLEWLMDDGTVRQVMLGGFPRAPKEAAQSPEGEGRQQR
jgi:hypothetical protein